MKKTPSIVSRLTSSLAAGVLFCFLGGCERADRAARTAKALLAENEALSLRVASERASPIGSSSRAREGARRAGDEADRRDTGSASRVARVAVCRESVAIVREQLEELDRSSRGELENLLGEAATQQERLCEPGRHPTAPDHGEQNRTSRKEQEMREVLQRLDALVPMTRTEQLELTRPYVPRLLEAVNAAREVVMARAEPEQEEATWDREAARRLEGAAERGRSSDTVEPKTDQGAGRQARQVWSPSPEVLAERRRQREAEFLRQLAAWRPAYRREFGPLRSTRRALSSKLAHSSLASSRAVCARLADAVAGIDSRIAGGSPDRLLNVQLERALEAYGAAAAQCASKSFVLAYKELLEADRWWSGAERRIERLGKNGGATPPAGSRRLGGNAPAGSPRDPSTPRRRR